MIYQVRANFFFNEEDEARDFYHDCEMAFPKTMIVNPTENNAEVSIVELILCHHDEDPLSPCTVLATLISVLPPPTP